MRFLTFLILCTGLCLAAPSFAVVEEQVSFDNPKHEPRYKKLIAELRCLVCQNQSLADSNAELAVDLRRKTVEMLNSGASDQDVRNYMSDRYGEFILYRPPLNVTTVILWATPFILLLGVLIGIFINIRKRQNDELYSSTRSNNEQTKVKVRNLLRDTPQIGNDASSASESVDQTNKTDQ